jgi:hypothetical protein
MIHCNNVNDDCTSYYIYTALAEQLGEFITNINDKNPSKIDTSIDLGKVDFYTNPTNKPDFILGEAQLNLVTGEISTVSDSYKGPNVSLIFVKKINNEKPFMIRVGCNEQEDNGPAMGNYVYRINDTKMLFQQDFLYKLDAFTSISAEKQSDSQTKKNTTLENILKKSSTIGDLINEYNKLTTLLNPNTKAALKALILEHYANVLNEINKKITNIETNENARIEEKNHNDEKFKKFYVTRLQERRDEYNSKFETSPIYIEGIKELKKKYEEGIKELKKKYEEDFPERTTKDELKKEYELQNKPVNQNKVGGKKTRRSRKTIHAKKYKTIRKNPFLHHFSCKTPPFNVLKLRKN